MLCSKIESSIPEDVTSGGGVIVWDEIPVDGFAHFWHGRVEVSVVGGDFLGGLLCRLESLDQADGLRRT